MSDPELYSVEVEENLVGAVLIQPGIFASLDITADHFKIHKHRFIWQAIDRLHRRGDPIDITVIIDELERMERLNAVGGPAYLTALANRTVSALNAEAYAKTVKNYAMRRAWLDIGSKMAKIAGNMEASLDHEASGIIDAMLKAVATDGAAVHISKYTGQVLDETMLRRIDPSDIWGIPTGFKDFDDITGGLQPSETLYISGEPGMGKSIMAAQMGLQMAKAKHPGAIYSLEMPGRQLVRRLLSAETKIFTRKIKSGKIDDSEFDSILKEIERFDDLPLYMSDSVHWTCASLRADIARMKAQHQVEWFVLDYAYLLQDGRGLSENDRTGFISAQLKAICRALDVAGIVIHSMNKAGISASLPGMTSVRGSAQQVYDTDLLLFLVEGDNQNEVRCIFGKGRELENPKQAFTLVKLPGYPKLGSSVISKDAIEWAL